MDKVNCMLLSCCDVPTVYSNKQSYYECLCYLGYKLNETIETLNSYSDDYKLYTDTAIANLKIYVDKQLSDVKDYTDAHVMELDKKLSSELGELKKNIKESLDYIDKKVEELNALTNNKFDREITTLYDYIKNHLSDEIRAYNPTTGLYDTISDCLSDMYAALRYLGITCRDFQNSEFTCEELDSMKTLTALLFDLYGKYKFKKVKELYMFRPYDGKYVYYQDAIYWSWIGVTYHYSLSTYDLDNKTNITAQAHDNIQSKAQDWDFASNEIFN